MATLPVPEPAQVVAAYLIGVGAGTAAGNDDDGVFRVLTDRMPSNPDNVIVVKNTSPYLDGRYMRGGKVVKHPGVQILVRSAPSSSWSAYQKAVFVEESLSQQYNTTIVLGDWIFQFQSFTLRSGANFVVQEEKEQRQVYTINGTVTIFAIPGV